jgi:hypothetical protein
VTRDKGTGTMTSEQAYTRTSVILSVCQPLRPRGNLCLGARSSGPRCVGTRSLGLLLWACGLALPWAGAGEGRRRCSVQRGGVKPDSCLPVGAGHQPVLSYGGCGASASSPFAEDRAVRDTATSPTSPTSRATISTAATPWRRSFRSTCSMIPAPTRCPLRWTTPGGDAARAGQASRGNGMNPLRRNAPACPSWRHVDASHSRLGLDRSWRHFDTPQRLPHAEAACLTSLHRRPHGHHVPRSAQVLPAADAGRSQLA